MDALYLYGVFAIKKRRAATTNFYLTVALFDHQNRITINVAKAEANFSCQRKEI